MQGSGCCRTDPRLGPDHIPRRCRSVASAVREADAGGPASDPWRSSSSSVGPFVDGPAMFVTTAGVGGYAARTGAGNTVAVFAVMSSIVYAMGAMCWVPPVGWWSISLAPARDLEILPRAGFEALVRVGGGGLTRDSWPHRRPDRRTPRKAQECPFVVAPAPRGRCGSSNPTGAAPRRTAPAAAPPRALGAAVDGDPCNDPRRRQNDDERNDLEQSAEQPTPRGADSRPRSVVSRRICDVPKFAAGPPVR